MDTQLSSLLLLGKQRREDAIGRGCPPEALDKFGGGVEVDVSTEGQCVTLCYCILHGYIEIDGERTAPQNFVGRPIKEDRMSHQ